MDLISEAKVADRRTSALAQACIKCWAGSKALDGGGPGAAVGSKSQSGRRWPSGGGHGVCRATGGVQTAGFAVAAAVLAAQPTIGHLQLRQLDVG